METTLKTQSAERRPYENSQTIQEKYRHLQRSERFVSKENTNGVALIKAEKRSTERIEPVEKPDQWIRCRSSIGDSLLNQVTPEVKCEVSVKEENTSDSEQTWYTMNEEAHISQEFLMSDPFSVKMEEEDEYSEEIEFIECRPGEMEEGLELIDESEMLEDFNRPQRGRRRTAERMVIETENRGRGRPRKPLTTEETFLMLEREGIIMGERLVNETAVQTRRISRLASYRQTEQQIQRTVQRKRRKNASLKRRETEKQRSIRLERIRMKRAEESQEERDDRLKRRRQWRSMYIAKETEEERAIRLARQKIAGLKWRSKLPEERRIATIERAKITQSRRLATETKEEKLERLARSRRARHMKNQKLSQEIEEFEAASMTGGLFKNTLDFRVGSQPWD